MDEYASIDSPDAMADMVLRIQDQRGRSMDPVTYETNSSASIQAREFTAIPDGSTNQDVEMTNKLEASLRNTRHDSILLAIGIGFIAGMVMARIR
jgi:hypothetical protein